MSLLSMAAELKELDKELQKKGTSVEAVIKSLLNFGKDLPGIFKRLEDMENLISKLELMDDIAGSLSRIEKYMEKK